MRVLCLPSQQQYKYVITGKFKAPTADWKHENMYLGEYELFVMTEGTMYLSYNGENFEVHPGEYLLLPPCNSFRQGYKEAYCAFYWLHFSADLGDSIPLSLAGGSTNSDTDTYYTLPQLGTLPNPEKVVVMMKQLQDMVKNNYPAVSLDAMSTATVTELYGQLARQNSISMQGGFKKQVYNDILDYIKTHIAENIKVVDVAEAFGYNEKYLSHRFAEVAGMPLKQYITRCKIDEANFMLSDTNKTISDIAAELGFSDSHNFARCYKKSTGLTPSEYRNAFSKRLLFHV